MRDNCRRERKINQIAAGGNYDINACAPRDFVMGLVVPDGWGGWGGRVVTRKHFGSVHVPSVATAERAPNNRDWIK